MSYRKRERERAELQALERLRSRIVGGIHSGHLNSGDRLPSYREISAQTGVDLRAVARIYTALATEGLLEIRGKAGAYVARQEHIAEGVLAETARWTASVLCDAWRRRISLPAYVAFVRRCIAAADIRCACVESTEDQITTLCTVLTRDFGFSTARVHADTLISLGSAGPFEPHVLDVLAAADLLVTTTFHSATVRTLAESLGKPLVVVRLDADFTARIEHHLARGELTVICADPRFVERVRLVFANEWPDRVRGILIDDARTLARVDLGQPALVTYEARRRAGSRKLPPSIQPKRSPVISSETAAELIRHMIRLNLEAMQSSQRSNAAANNAFPPNAIAPAARIAAPE